MKFFKLGLSAGAAVAALAGGTANATVYIGYSVNGGVITDSGVSGATSASFAAKLGSLFRVINASGSTGALPALLDSAIALEKIGGRGATLDLFVTATDFSSLSAIFKSTYSVLNLPVGWTLTESTYYDVANGKFGGTPVTAAGFASPGMAIASSGPLWLSGPFSITQQYHIVAPTSTGYAAATDSLVAVPETATWALMLGGFGLAGLSLRGRSAKVRIGYNA